MRLWKKLLRIACFTITGAIFVATAGLAQIPSTTAAASPELVGQLTQQLSIPPAQATGGAGALFSMAKSRLPAGDFSKVAAAVPGMGSFLKAAPSTNGSTASSALSSLSGSLPSGMGGLASTAGAFEKLGLSPTMAGKFVPVLTQFVQAKGGSEVASLLPGSLK
jgi:hypothetical protein